MSVTVNFTLEKKHFLILGLIIAIPFIILAINTITAAGPTGQYHSASELYVDSNIDMNKHNLTNTGNIGIGITNPIEKLEVNGTIKANAFLYSSDERLKEKIQKINNSLNKITKLNGVSYIWKENGAKSIGLTAQNVEIIFPELVNTNKDSGLKSVEYGNLVAPLIEAIKEQQIILNKQKESITELQNQIDTLKIEIIK